MSKRAANKAADIVRHKINSEPVPSYALTVGKLVEAYRLEKMPTRPSTKRGYGAWLKNPVLPVWGNRFLTDMQTRPELWLQSLSLSPKSKTHIRGLLHGLCNVAGRC